MKRAQPFMLVVFGAIAFMNAARNSRFEAFHAVDVVSLMASGLCLGAAFTLILRNLRLGMFK